MGKVSYVDPDGTTRTVTIPDGENVMHGAQYNGIDGIIGECGGGLACATCHCYVDEAWFAKTGGPASQDEIDMLDSTAAELRPTSRLSCQIVMATELDGLVVHVPDRQF
jgi:ferredoxin, 2Fe-2S